MTKAIYNLNRVYAFIHKYHGLTLESKYENKTLEDIKKDLFKEKT